MATKSKAQESWRRFEILISQIESALVPIGAKITTPDKIPDLVTGTLREVDASIRYQLGSTPVLVTIECRDRSRKGDVQWIEQLATKKENIGASQTLAVSARGFSREALDLARRKGIEVRNLNEGSLPDIFKLLDITSIELLKRRLTIIKVDFHFYGPSEHLKPNPVVFGDLVADEAYSAKVFRLIKANKPVSMKDILMGFDDPKWSPFNDVPSDGNSHRVKRVVLFDDETLTAPTTNGPVCVKRFYMEADLTVKSVPNGNVKAFNYQNPSNTVGQGLQQTFLGSDGGEFMLTLCKEPDSNEIKCSFVKVAQHEAKKAQDELANRWD